MAFQPSESLRQWYPSSPCAEGNPSGEPLSPQFVPLEVRLQAAQHSKRLQAELQLMTLRIWLTFSNKR